MKEKDIEKLEWEHTVNIDRILITLSTFIIGYFHFEQNLIKNFVLTKYLLITTFIGILFLILNYCLIHFYIKISNKSKYLDCLNRLSKITWYFAVIIFLISLMGLIFIILVDIFKM